jgi:hypothetical protein
MPVPINTVCNAKLISYQKLVTVVRDYNTQHSIFMKSMKSLTIACNVFKEIKELFPNKNFYEQTDLAIDAFKNNPDKYTKMNDVIRITI